MVDALTELVTGAAGGVWGGVFGSVVGAVGKYANQRLELKKLVMENKHVEAMQTLQLEADQRMAEQKLLLTREEGSWSTLNSAIQAEGNITNTSQAVNDIRGLWRIVLTIILWALAVSVWALDDGTSAQTVVLMQSLLFGASSATGFWFGGKAVTSLHR